jgi:hypothetical protein
MDWRLGMLAHPMSMPQSTQCRIIARPLSKLARGAMLLASSLVFGRIARKPRRRHVTLSSNDYGPGFRNIFNTDIIGWAPMAVSRFGLQLASDLRG